MMAPNSNPAPLSIHLYQVLTPYFYLEAPLSSQTYKDLVVLRDFR